ncbi:hypothetical protein PGT21_036392 [Puccinia graminis f. sp. tritici]|uniref:Uncharacterized protein n=1 Tax=Puccinia graminis f. sp. tritici TaxID=56615 RepID=A0A5B0NEK2_PUCGR|nr:hypothetical protein PGT21_036392 [Puccinia graminis f. sp. tritici]KAA1138153.1 hypothetical protein PGTUg99_008996 [Puccinia graminis f. sp. tritici]
MIVFPCYLHVVVLLATCCLQTISHMDLPLEGVHQTESNGIMNIDDEEMNRILMVNKLKLKDVPNAEEQGKILEFIEAIPQLRSRPNSGLVRDYVMNPDTEEGKKCTELTVITIMMIID